LREKVCRILKLRDDTDIIRNNLIYYYNIGIETQYIMLHMPTPELLSIIDAVQSELDMNVGWQDPAIIKETGLCVWQSGNYPKLEIKRNGVINS